MKISTLLRVIPVIFTLVGLTTLVFLYVAMSNERKILDNQSRFKQLGLDMMQISDTLTNQARFYVQYGEQEYLTAYTTEVYETRTREAILTQLVENGAKTNEITLAENAFNLSVSLQNLEKRAFSYVAEANFEAARALMFSNEYNLEKDKIQDQITLFQQALAERYEKDVARAQLIVLIASSVIAVVFIGIVLTLFISFRFFNKKLAIVGELSEITAKIAEGDFDIHVADNHTDDEFSAFSNSLLHATDVVKRLVGDVQHLSDAHARGDINTRIDTSGYSGYYLKMTEATNAMAASYSTMVYEIVDSLRLFSEGSFHSTLQPYSGAKSELNLAFDRLHANLNHINNELIRIMQDASIGNFSSRSDASRFSGDFAAILDGLNALLEIIINRMIDSAPLAYAVLSDGAILEANAYARDFVGFTKGKLLQDYCLEQIDSATVQDLLIKKDGIANLRASIRIPSGETHLFHIVLRSIQSGGHNNVIFWGLDVYEDEKKKDSLKRAQADFQKLIDSIPIPLLIASPVTHELIYCNNHYLNLFRFERLEDAFRFTLNSLRFQDDTPKTTPLANIIDSWDFDYKFPNGQDLSAKVFESEVVYNGNRSKLKIIQDLSYEKNREKLLLSAADKEREANQLKNRFIVNMSHEIRTPMNAIIGLSKLALMHKQDQENYLTYQKIHTSAKGLLSIINDILDFSKLDSEQLSLANEPFYIEELVHNAFTLAAERRETKDITMLADLAYDLPCEVCGDRALVWQVMKNLLDNAAKFTDSGRIILSASVASRTESTVNLRFRIEDTGVGMTPAELSSLFEPFEQFHNHTKLKVTGTGLGLSITKRLTELVGGTIQVQSHKDIGTVAEIILPFGLPTDYTSILQSLSACNVLHGDILIADSDTEAVHLLQRFVQTAAAVPVCIQSGAALLTQVLQYKKLGKYFPIIFIDYRIEKNSEASVSEIIKKYSPHSKLVLLSDFSKDILLMEPGFKINLSHFDEIIEKPFTPLNLMKRLTDMLHGAKPEPSRPYMKFQNARVLVCEDNQLNQEVAQNILAMFGITAVVANNGFEALMLLNNEYFDLIFMDIIMPGLDGHETTKIIRASDADFKHIKIVALTANAMQDEVDACYEEGMNGYIVKPIEIDELYEALLTHLPAQTHMPQEEATVASVTHPAGDGTEGANTSLDGIDLQAALTRFGGKKDLYFNALRRFVSESCDTGALGDFNSIVSSENKQETLTLVHTLKGVAGNLGVSRIFDAARDFERSLKNGMPSLPLFNDLKDALCSVKSTILAGLPQEKEKDKHALPVGSGKDCHAILSELKGCLERFEPSACEEPLAQLQQKSWECLTTETVMQIADAVDGYQFDEAIAVINERLDSMHTKGARNG